MISKQFGRAVRWIIERILCLAISAALILNPIRESILFASVMGLAAASMRVWADPPPGAADGQNLGNSLLQGPTTDGQTIYFQGSQGAQSISVNSLFQARGSADDVQAMENAYGNNDAASAVSSAVTTRLQTENSQQAAAYQTVQQSAQTQAHPDLSNDPALFASQTTLSPNDPLFQTFFGDCAQTTTTSGSGLSVHVKDLQYCETVSTPTTKCELTHQYAVHVMDLVTATGPTERESCGDGCLEIYMGKDEYADGTYIKDQRCGIFEQDYNWTINPDAIISATLEEVGFDDYADVQINGTHVYEGPWGSFPTWASATVCAGYGCNVPCENGIRWDFTPNTDITNILKSQTNAMFVLRVNVGGDGEHTRIRLRVRYDPTKVVASDQWNVSPDCKALITAIADKACTVNDMRCLTGPSMDVQCVTDQNGYQVCQDDFGPAPIAGFSPLCTDGQIDANCQFNAGAMQCWVDPNGVQHCPQNDASQPDGCTSYESNKSCAFLESSCLPFAKGQSGTCYAFEETWDCGYNVSTPAPTSTQLTCDGPIQCMGNACVSPTAESNQDFIKAAATLSAMQFMAQDMSCPNGDPTDCSVFGGSPMNCKIALGGVANCCNEPVSVGLLQYLELAKATYDLARKLRVAQWLADEGLDVPGAWSAVENWASSTWSTITEPFTSAWGSLAQNFGDTGAENIASFTLADLEQSMMQATQEWVSNTFGTQVADVFFSQSTNAAGDEITTLSDTFATALSVIMWVYTIYVIVTVLIGIAWPCNQSEFELAARKQMNLCDFVGTYCAENSVFGCIEIRRSYCCYNSPLARIVMEGARPQLGMSMGTPIQPDCDGLTLSQLAGIDWSKVDLSQWYGIEAQAGLIPSTTGGFNSQYSLDTTTRDPDATASPNATERIQSEVDAAQYFDQAREKVREDLWNAVPQPK